MKISEDNGIVVLEDIYNSLNRAAYLLNYFQICVYGVHCYLKLS